MSSTIQHTSSTKNWEIFCNIGILGTLDWVRSNKKVKILVSEPCKQIRKKVKENRDILTPNKTWIKGGREEQEEDKLSANRQSDSWQGCICRMNQWAWVRHSPFSSAFSLTLVENITRSRKGVTVMFQGLQWACKSWAIKCASYFTRTCS